MDGQGVPVSESKPAMTTGVRDRSRLKELPGGYDVVAFYEGEIGPRLSQRLLDSGEPEGQPDVLADFGLHTENARCCKLQAARCVHAGLGVVFSRAQPNALA